jgi:uric acid transporter
MSTSESGTRDTAKPPVHPVDEVLPAPRLTVLGLQHLFIMYAGAIAVPFVVGGALKLSAATIALLVNADLLVAGIATLIQAVGVGKLFGVRLPVVAGATFTVIPPMITIAAKFGGEKGLPYVYGAMLCSGVFGLLIAKPFAKVIRFFPPLVAGIVITVIGLSLIGPAAGMIAGHDTQDPHYGQVSHILVAFAVVFGILILARTLRGFLGQIAPLLAIIGGALLALLTHSWSGSTRTRSWNLSGVGHADWLGFAAPFHFGAPRFDAAAVISMCIVMLVTYTESTADMIAVAEMTGKELSDGDITRGLAADGLSALLGGSMNSFPDTLFAENVGLVQMTGVRSRWVTAVTGGFLVVMGVVPKVGAFVAAVPEFVVGGAALVMFATVTAVGIQTLKKAEFQGNHNLLIVATSLGLSLLPAYAMDRFGNSIFFEKFPDWAQIVFGSPITIAVVAAFTLNLVFNHLGGGVSVPGSGVPGAVVPVAAVSGGAVPGGAVMARPAAGSDAASALALQRSPAASPLP